MSDKELKKSFDSIQKHFEEFHEKMLGKEARFNEFEEFEKLHDAVNSIFFDGFSRKEKIEPELWNSIEALHDKSLDFHKELLSRVPVEELEREAEAGETEAAWWLIYRHENQLGVSDDWISQNSKNILRWSEIAIKGCEAKGLSWRKWNVAYDYLENQNFERAIELLTEASEEGEMQADFMLGCLYSEGDIEPDAKLAKAYFERGIEQQDDRAFLALARLYLIGDVLEEDERQTFKLAGKASALGSDEGKELLANCYEFAWGTRQNRPKAYRLYQELGPDFSDDNLLRVATDFLDGISVPKNTKLGIELLETASSQGHAEASTNLALIYGYGFDVDQDEPKAMEYIERALGADETPVRAMIYAGASYAIGRGAKQDLEKAEYWLRQAYSDAETEGQKAEAEAWLEQELGITFSD